ncbi:MAG: BlaI/MecI/CopY family transcriptional regulator [Chitinophagaceae bacterium]|nr:BlaI/MecI/CopY family transcriptional regulator [Chitinophagaceae bacterium]
MNPLTRAEEEIMQQVWKLKGGFLREIVEAMPEPRPHQNTVATLLKIMAEKGFIKIEPYGKRAFKYLPGISRTEYSKGRVNSLVRRFYEGSFSNVVSAMVKDNNVSIAELELLIKQLKKENK